MIRMTALAAAAGLSACASAPPPPVAAAPEPLAFERFFPGRTEGSGVFVNSWTGYERRFDVVIESTWDGRTLTLVEDFAYADGETDRKTWRLTRTGDRTFTGTREDVVGEARAFADGAAMRLEYDVLLGGWTLRFRDVLALEPDGRLYNAAVVSKWGLKVGRVELRLRRVESAARPLDRAA